MAKENKFFKGLKRLFSGEVIVRHVGKKQLKIVDTDTVQLAHQVDRFNRLRKRDTINLGVVNQYSYSDTRIELFRDYESMDRDAIISSALDLYSEECVVGETIIPLLDGTKKTIKELYDDNYTNF